VRAATVAPRRSCGACSLEHRAITRAGTHFAACSVDRVRLRGCTGVRSPRPLRQSARASASPPARGLRGATRGSLPAAFAASSVPRRGSRLAADVAPGSARHRLRLRTRGCRGATPPAASSGIRRFQQPAPRLACAAACSLGRAANRRSAPALQAPLTGARISCRERSKLSRQRHQRGSPAHRFRWSRCASSSKRTASALHASPSPRRARSPSARALPLRAASAAPPPAPPAAEAALRGPALPPSRRGAHVRPELRPAAAHRPRAAAPAAHRLRGPPAPAARLPTATARPSACTLTGFQDPRFWPHVSPPAR
jgi:hypothetical protein